MLYSLRLTASLSSVEVRQSGESSKDLDCEKKPITAIKPELGPVQTGRGKGGERDQGRVFYMTGTI